VVIGRFLAGPHDDWGLLQRWAMGRIMAGGTLKGASLVLGTHYEGVSAVYRAMGARIGALLWLRKLVDGSVVGLCEEKRGITF
jgi:hypothetical protein